LKPYTLKLFLFLCISTLAACDMQAVKHDQETTDETLPVTERQTTLSEEAQRLLGFAEDSDSAAEQQLYRAKAARLYIEAGDIQRAKQQRNILEKQFASKPPAAGTETDSAKATLSLLSAEIAIAEQNLLLASELIAKTKPITRQQQIDFYTAKANLDYLSGDYMHTVDRRVQLDAYITDEADRKRNNQKIWAALSNVPTVQLRKQRSKNPTITGWLDLANVMRSGQHNISQLEDDLLDWGMRHPSHPVGKSFLSELIDDYQVDTSDKKHIAVILPLEGDLSKVSDTIKNGLLSAYYSDSDSPIKPVISFYDNSSEDLTFQQLYQQAIDDGATNIIDSLLVQLLEC